MFAVWIVAASLLAAIESEMTPQDVAKTGISKLSGAEKTALQEWIDHHYWKKLKRNKKEPGPILQENLQNGRFIGLSDHSIWEILPADTPITQSWITAVEIKIEPSSDSDYPYKLTNTLTGSSIKAKKQPVN
jgi:hypothetical protein